MPRFKYYDGWPNNDDVKISMYLDEILIEYRSSYKPTTRGKTLFSDFHSVLDSETWEHKWFRGIRVLSWNPLKKVRQHFGLIYQVPQNNDTSKRSKRSVMILSLYTTRSKSSVMILSLYTTPPRYRSDNPWNTGETATPKEAHVHKMSATRKRESMAL